MLTVAFDSQKMECQIAGVTPLLLFSKDTTLEEYLPEDKLTLTLPLRQFDRYAICLSDRVKSPTVCGIPGSILIVTCRRQFMLNASVQDLLSKGLVVNLRNANAMHCIALWEHFAEVLLQST